ncbi:MULTISPECIES: hypothetical protein [Cyanophyceae]|uniref:Uncharacterized protein n=2 Tax=Cyanophyceae TaxID=3028117 RepID=A0A4Q7EAE7_9CYAN|nr:MULTISPECIES: hypothetical protein [Cyanophyceae]MCM1983670.1 hypothetical protein [Lyngbya confervoides BDU141951]RZM79561.1 hypothetical protein DYY88_12645 [Leptolyngbya sp. LK]
MTCPYTDKTRPTSGTVPPICPYAQQQRLSGLSILLAIGVVVLTIAVLMDLRPTVCQVIAPAPPDAVEAAPSQQAPADADGIKFWPENE